MQYADSDGRMNLPGQWSGGRWDRNITMLSLDLSLLASTAESKNQHVVKISCLRRFINARRFTRSEALECSPQ